MNNYYKPQCIRISSLFFVLIMVILSVIVSADHDMYRTQTIYQTENRLMDCGNGQFPDQTREAATPKQAGCPTINN